MKRLFVAILLGLSSFVPIRANNQDYSICHICGSESYFVTNPDVVIPIPENYDSSVDKLDCGMLEEAGRDGRISEDDCMDLLKSSALKSFCGCLDSTEISDTPAKPSDVPIKTPADSSTAVLIFTALPTALPALYIEDGVESETPSTSPSDAPSDSSSSAPSNTASAIPSAIPSSGPSLYAKDISGTDSSTATSGAVAPSFYVIAVGVIVAVIYLYPK